MGDLAVSSGGSGTLSFSKHIPVHAQLRDAAEGTAAGSMQKLPDCRKGPAATQPRTTQMAIASSGSGLTLAAPAKAISGSKRRRGGAATGRGTAQKRQRGASCDTTELRIRKRAELNGGPPATAAAATLKRKHGTAKHGKSPLKLVAQHGQKRKSAHGFNAVHSAQLAHCDSGNSTYATHRAGGSLHVGGQNATKLLSSTVMRPLD